MADAIAAVTAVAEAAAVAEAEAEAVAEAAGTAGKSNAKAVRTNSGSASVWKLLFRWKPMGGAVAVTHAGRASSSAGVIDA